MSPKLKPWLVLAVIFIAGGLSGAALTIALAPYFMHAHTRLHDPAHIREDIMAGLTRELSLTPDQQAKIQPIVEQAAKELQEVHRDEIDRVSHIINLANDQMAPILTPDQKAQLDKLKAEGGAGMFFGRPHGWGPSGGFHGGGPEGGGPPRMPPPGPPGVMPGPAGEATNQAPPPAPPRP